MNFSEFLIKKQDEFISEIKDRYFKWWTDYSDSVDKTILNYFLKNTIFIEINKTDLIADLDLKKSAIEFSLDFLNNSGILEKKSNETYLFSGIIIYKLLKQILIE